MANRILIFVFTIAIAVVLTGCSDPYSQERLRRREANREQFFRRAAESESRRPAKLQKTFNMLNLESVITYEGTETIHELIVGSQLCGQHAF